VPSLDKVFFNGKVVPKDQAMVSVESPAVKYGISVFEGIRAYYNAEAGKLYILLLDEHSRRLVRSMRLLRMEDIFGFEYVRNAVLELLRATRPRTDLHIRQTVFLDGDGGMGAEGPLGMAVVATPRGRPGGFEEGISCQVSSWTRISDNITPPRVKCNANYVNGRYASVQAALDGYDNAILLNRSGHVAEAPGACLFMVKDGQPVTPGVTSDILESITRAKIMELLQEHLNLETVERDVHRTELYGADEVFLCGTAAEVTPVVSVDRLAVGGGVPGPVTRELQRLLIGVARGEIPDHQEWRTEA